MLSKDAKREYQRDYMRNRRAGIKSAVEPIDPSFHKLNWKDIPGYPGYQASDCGQIMSLKRTMVRDNGRSHTVPARILSQNPDSNGYMQVGVYVDKKRITALVHHLVYAAWIGDRPKYLRVDHIDGKKLNNRWDNLQLLTNQQNVMKGWEDAKKAARAEGYAQALKDMKEQY
jgi:hypothetical protein